MNPLANDLVLHSEGTNYSFALSHSVLSPTSPIASPGGDVFFFVSGTQGGIGNDGVALFTGDAVVSGSLRARELKMTTHKADPNDSNPRYVRFDSNGSDLVAGVGDDNKMVTPYIGTLIKVVARSTIAAGSTAIGLHTNVDGQEHINGTATESITVNMASANTAYTFNFTGAANWGSGDIVGLSFNPSQDPGGIIFTAVWEFESYS